MPSLLTLQHRSSGVLLHPTSLPGPHGIGDLGPSAYEFIDFLSQSGQRWWQMFPLGPPGVNNSPYQVLSAFAGNTLLINLHQLVRQGLLKPGDIQGAPSFPGDRVDFAKVWQFKKVLFRQAYLTFEKRTSNQKNRFESFCEQHRSWLDDFSLYCALKAKYKGRSWVDWEEGDRLRRPKALATAQTLLFPLIRYHKFLQYQFWTQWKQLRDYGREKGVGIIGDIPIFVAHDSADVWAHPKLFWLNKRGHPLYVAGVPPDYFSKTGQRWGNPLYRWKALRGQRYDWWVQRFRFVFKLCDAVRLDHFIGFQRYWRIPAEEKTAKKGRWINGPGAHFFESIRRQLGRLDFIAEDLGLITPEVKALRDRFQFPGMRVLQFAFGNEAEGNNYLPHNFIRRCVAYTGTHDNDTTVGWFKDTGGKQSTRTTEAIRKEREFALRYMNSNGKEIHWDMIRLALMSVADTVVIPVQDLLGLGSDARINRPGTPSGNWEWRLRPGALTAKVSDRLMQLTKTYGR